MNAKELILAKINAGTNLARCYLHLIMMGFDINEALGMNKGVSDYMIKVAKDMSK